MPRGQNLPARSVKKERDVVPSMKSMSDVELAGVAKVALPEMMAAETLNAVFDNGGGKAAMRQTLEILGEAISNGDDRVIDRTLSAELIVMDRLAMDLIRRAQEAPTMGEYAALVELGARVQNQVLRTSVVLSERKRPRGDRL